MRWRYLILGIFLAVPLATALQVWPQLPVFLIPDGRQYLVDDPANRQLLFYFDSGDNLPPIIERYDADSGRLLSILPLSIAEKDTTSKWAMVDSAMISSDLGTIGVFNLGVPLNETFLRMNVTFFDALTGKRHARESTFLVAHRKGFSPNGKWFAMVQGRGQLTIIDTKSCRTHWQVGSPNVESYQTGVCFSPDSRYLLYQWAVDDDSARTLHLLNLELRQIEATFQLPPGRWLCDWRGNDLWSFEMMPYQPYSNPVRRYRHAFDGRTLGAGVADPLLVREYIETQIPDRLFETDSWAGQFETHAPRQPDWAPLLERLQDYFGLRFVRTPAAIYSGRVRIIDRSTKTVMFEKGVPDTRQCRLAMDGKLLIVNTKEDSFDHDLFAAPPTTREKPPKPFEIYRTDIWPRWIWTTLGTGCLLAAFALLARWRHVVIRRRRLGEPGA